MIEWKTSPCRSCHEPMIWTVTRNGKKMPVDAEETSRAAAGPKALLFELQESDEDKRTPLATLTKASEGYASHWGTCANFKR